MAKLRKACVSRLEM